MREDVSYKNMDWQAGCHLARNCAPGALHNVDLITDMVLQMAHRNISLPLFVIILISIEKL